MSAPARRGRRSQLPLRLGIWIAGLLVLLNGIIPLGWMLLTSLKTSAELNQLPITYLPQAPTLTNYGDVFSQQPMLRYLLNSLIVGLSATVLCIWIGTMAGYALARLKLRRRNLLLSLLIGLSLFPTVTILVPLFQVMRSVGLLNTYPALILPYTALSLPVTILVLMSFFSGIPRDLESAAMVDGCTRLQALWRVVVPLAAPGVFTAAILAFVNSWDEFLLALSLTTAQSMHTAPVGITLFEGEFAFPWRLISAALVVAMIPITVMIVVFQERVVSGLTTGGLKG